MRLLSLAIGLFMSFFVQGQQVAKHLRASNGVNIGFYQFTPKDYNNGQKHPVIIFLHGIGERGNGGSELNRVAKQGIPKLIKKGEDMTFTYKGKRESFVVLSPQLSKKYGAWQNFYVEEMIEYATKYLKIDPNRIYLTGMSLGGGGVWSFSSASLANANKLAAIATICATCKMSNGKNIADADLPVWSFHAKNDSRVSVNCTNNAIDRIISFRPSVRPKKTIWSTGNHSIWDRAFNPSTKGSEPNIYEWFLSHKRTGAKSPSKTPSKNTGDNVKLPVSVNKKPVAKVINYLTTRLPDNSLIVNGERSYDPDGRIVNYFWRKVSGPSSYTILNNESRRTRVSNLTAGTYIFQLKVTDNKGSTDVANVRVVVQPRKK